MAACGGIERIFEKPLSETPTLLEVLSPWKHIKSMNPIEDSSFTEMFGELHFKESHVHSPPSDQERERGPCRSPRERKKEYPRNESVSSDSLSLCTEGLGSESFDEMEEMTSHDLCSDRGWREGERNNIPRPENNRSEAAARASRGEYPPPITCIERCGKPWVCFKSYREDGRFILKEIRIPTQEYLHACRRDGRMKLQFVHSDDDELPQEQHQEEVAEEQNEGQREKCR